MFLPVYSCLLCCTHQLISYMECNSVLYISVSASLFPRITPNQQQFFHYESISINCHHFNNLTEWRVMRKLKEEAPAKASIWETSTRARTIKTAYQTDSGEYWCEDKEGKRSKSVHITVTGMFNKY